MPELFIDWGRGPDDTAIRCRSSTSGPMTPYRALIDSWALTEYLERFPTHRPVCYMDYGVQILEDGRAYLVSEWILSERFHT